MRAAVLLIVAIPMVAVQAQPVTPSDEAADPEPSAALQEITVTARKREENLQDTPISVSVLTASDLTQRSVAQLPDIVAYTPNLRSSGGPQGGSSGHYYIRGIGQLDFIASTDPGVGTYLDGVYFGRTTGSALDLLDVERVEVLRGPQGTLFGRNTMGGAISIVSAEPPAESAGRVTLNVGDRNLYEARVKAGGPLIEDKLLADVAVLAKSRDGWQRRLTDGGTFGDEETYAARGSLAWSAVDRLKVLVALDATRGRGTADPHYLAFADAARGGRPEYVVTDPRTTWSGQRADNNLDVRGSSVTATYSLGSVMLKSITAYRTLDSDTGIDFDGSPFDDLDQRVLTRQSQRSQELQVGGSALSERLSWLTGLYYFGERVSQDIPLVFYGSHIAQNNDLSNNSYAAFSHLTYSLAPRVSVSGGARFTRETKQHAFENYIDHGTSHEPLFAPTTLRDDWHAFTPKLGAEFHLSPAVMLYSSVSQGFRSGGFNGRPLGSATFLSYEPEKVTSYEIGIKAESARHRVRFNAAAFHSRFKDIQLTISQSSPIGVIVVTGNAGRAKLSGLETELTAALSSRATVNASVGYLTNKYTELQQGAALSRDASLPVAPRWTLNTGIDYILPLARAGALRAHVDYSCTSRYNYLFDNPPQSWQEAYGLLNARVTYEPASASWQIAAYVLNATDREHSSFREDILASAGVAIVWPARPREWGAEIEFRF